MEVNSRRGSSCSSQDRFNIKSTCLTEDRWSISRAHSLLPARSCSLLPCWRTEIGARLRGPRLYESRQARGSPSCQPITALCRPREATRAANPSQPASSGAEKHPPPFRTEHEPRDAVGTLVSESWRRKKRLPWRLLASRANEMLTQQRSGASVQITVCKCC